MKKLLVCIVGLPLVLFLSVGLAYSAMDILLKIDGIDGESQINGHEDEIDVLSWDWGVLQSGSLHAGVGSGSGKAQIQDISIVKYIDKASADLLLKCLNGSHLTEAVLTVRKAGENPIDYLEITLSPVMVTSVGTGGEGGEDYHTEIVTLNFGKVKFSYTPQKKDGSPEASIDFTWNIEKNLEE